MGFLKNKIGSAIKNVVKNPVKTLINSNPLSAQANVLYQDLSGKSRGVSPQSSVASVPGSTVDVNPYFQQYLGRDATPDEQAYLNKYISAGNLQPAEISTILQSHPEYQNKLLQQNTADLNKTLTANDTAYLSKAADTIGAQANSRFAGLGRQNSSAMAAQVYGQTGQIASDLAQQRQNALSSFYGQGLANNAQMAGMQGQSSLSQAYGLQNQKLQRQWQKDDYAQQQNDYQNYLNAHSGWNAITPEFIGNGIFSLAGQAAAAYGGRKAGMPTQQPQQQGGLFPKYTANGTGMWRQ